MTTVLHVGTDEGVRTLRSEDGSTWEEHKAQMPTLSVEEVVVVPSRPHIVLAGTRGDGVWRSEDGGATFSKPSRGRRGPGKVRCLTLDPVNDSRVYAGTEPIDLYVSDDLGEHWEVLESLWEHPWTAQVDYPVANVEPHVRDIAIDPSNPDVLYLALQVGYILKSVDGAKSWTLLNEGFDADVHTFAINPAAPNELSIATGGESSRRGVSGGKALFKSADAGESWQALATEYSQTYSIPYLLKPGQPETAYVALANGNPGRWRARESGAESVLVRTRDGGTSWEEVPLPFSFAGRGMIVAMTPDATDAERLFAVFNTGELIASADGGESWSDLGLRFEGPNDLKSVAA
ncbi:MAG TPA: hypothetical protein VNF07_06415 [Acidimicrobiales bacterium]|nr:hypothetical protein [Acidimicrobiales bacterium]